MWTGCVSRGFNASGPSLSQHRHVCCGFDKAGEYAKMSDREFILM